MAKRESLYHRYPNYRVDLKPLEERVRVHWDGKLLADSSRALLVLETDHDPVIYLPREDVSFAHLESTDHETFCPFKGEASYWSARSAERVDANLAWSYEDPFDEVAGLKGYLSFYADRVEWTRG